MIARKKHNLILMSLLVFLLLYPSMVFAQVFGEDRPSKPGLKLSQEQKDKIRGLRLKGKKEEIRLKSDLKIARLELRELLQQDELDKSRINRKIEEMGNLRTELQKLRIERRMEMREVLSKEQLQILRERRMKRKPDKRLLERRMRGNEGRFHRRGMQGMRSLSGEFSQPFPPCEFGEMPLEPGPGAFEDELFSTFDEIEPVPVLEEPPLSE